MRPQGLLMRSRVLLVSVAALGVSGVLAQAASACEVENTTSHAKYSEPTGALQSAVEGAVAGNTLKVTGTCEGDTTIGKNLTVEGKSATATMLKGNGSGSVVTVTGSATVTIKKLKITGGDANEGGGLFVEGGAKAIVESVTFADNEAYYGAGVDNAEGVITVSKSTFTENTSGSYGAALMSFGGEVTITKSTVTKNRGGCCGALAEQGASSYLVTGSKIVSNETQGVAVVGSSVTLEDAKIEKNVALGEHGAGVNIGEGGNLTLINSSIKSNEALTGGGIQIYETGNIYLYGNSSIEKNKATEHGGGIYRESESADKIVEEPGWTGKITKNTPDQIYSEGP